LRVRFGKACARWPVWTARSHRKAASRQPLQDRREKTTMAIKPNQNDGVGVKKIRPADRNIAVSGHWLTAARGNHPNTSPKEDAGGTDSARDRS